MSTLVSPSIGTATPSKRVDASPASNGQLAGTGLLFLMYVAVLVIEYGGLSQMLPILKVTRASTLLAWTVAVGVIVKVGARSFTEFRQSRLLIALVLWTGASVAWAVVRSYVPENFRYMCDYFGLFVATLYLVDRPSRMIALSVSLTLVTILLVVNNASHLNSPTRFGDFKASYFMSDGNDFGWGLVTLVMFPLYLCLARHNIALRLLGAAGLGMGLIGVVGTQSRGASLAVAAGFGCYALFISKRRALATSSIVVLLIGAWLFAPSSYRQRMQSLEAYQDDNSAQGRLRAWRAAARMGLEFPLGVGAGNFNSAYGRYYRDRENVQGWAANRWISAHSVYFKILGEYGYIGLVILVTLLLTNVRDNLASVRRTRQYAARTAVPEQWPGALTLGVVGYSVAAMFLGGVTYPHLFMLTGLTVGCRRLLDATQVEATVVAKPAPRETPRLAPSVVDIRAGARPKAPSPVSADFVARPRSTGTRG